MIFDGTEGVRSCFHVLRSRTRFRRYGGRWVPFSCFAHRLIFGGNKGVGCRFLVLRSRTYFLLCRVRWVPFSCSVRPDSFFTVPRETCFVFMFFAESEGVGSRFHVLCARTHFQWYRGRRVPYVLRARTRFGRYRGRPAPVFKFCATELIFGNAECVGSRFHVLRAWTGFRWYRGRRVPFSNFARPDSFSAVPSVSGPVFMICAPELIFKGTEVVGYRFHVFRARTRFRRYRGRRVPFSCFLRPNSFSTVPRATGPVFMFCAPGLVFGSTEGVGSHFHVLHSRTHFRRYRGRRVLFSVFALPDSFSAIQRASGPIFMICPLGHVFGCTEVVRFRFNVLRARTHFRRYRGC
jgi:hypothetical protein